MGNLKKFTKLMLCSAVLTSPILSTNASAEPPAFKDIDNSFAKDAILELVDKGIIVGNGEGKFNPTGKITRAEFAIVLARALGLDINGAPATATFSDVPTSDWTYKYVEAAAKAGIIKGYGDGTFKGNSNLSRQDMATLFVRALGVDATGYGEKLSFNDASSIPTYAKDAIGYAVEMGLINGYGNNTFNPAGLAERQAVALVASNFLVVKEQVKPEPKPEPKPTPPPPPVQNPEPIPDPQPVDRTAPVLSDVTNSFVVIGEYVQATSNESGELYLVPKETTKSLSSFKSVIDGRNGVKAISLAGHPNLISTTELVAGTYVLYAVDSSSNISLASADIVIITVERAAGIQRLNEAINNNDHGEESLYTETSWAVYQDKLQAAQTVKNNLPQASTENIDMAAQALESAFEGLTTKEESARTAAIERLQNAIATESALVQSDYTSETWTVYYEELQAAKTLNTDLLTAEEIGTAAIQLENAISGLIVISKMITNFDYSSSFAATQARLTSIPVIDINFASSPKQFTISDGTVSIFINLNWNLPTDIGFTKGQMVGSAIDSMIQDYCNANQISLLTRPMAAVGYSDDTFSIFTFDTGSNKTITLSGRDWSYFFQSSSATGEDENHSKNRSFTVSDGTKTATINLQGSYQNMTGLVEAINQQLSAASVAATAVEVSESQFEIRKTTDTKMITVSGTNKAEFFGVMPTE